MHRLPMFRSISICAACAALVACAGPGEPPPSVSRTRPPEGYEQTISNYFAFKFPGALKNGQLTFGRPEPGDCSLDGHANSIRGWVVPVAYETRKGQPTGKETIHITIRQVYFWFLRDTIAGVTPRIELCPGVGSGVADLVPAGEGGGLRQAPAVEPTSAPSPARARADAAAEAPAPAPAAERATPRATPSRKAKSSAARAPARSGRSAGAPTTLRKPAPRADATPTSQN